MNIRTLCRYHIMETIASKSVPHCAGIIVIDNDKTILVKTHKGNLSFPKGKAKGKKEKKEQPIQTAWRELEEETGLTSDNVLLISDFCLDELSPRGNISVRYFVGRLLKQKENFKFDDEELLSVEWYKVEDVMKLDRLKQERKIILRKAYDLV